MNHNIIAGVFAAGIYGWAAPPEAAIDWGGCEGAWADVMLEQRYNNAGRLVSQVLYQRGIGKFESGRRLGPKKIPIPVSRGPYDRGPRSGRSGPPGGSSGPEGGGGGGSAGMVSAYYVEGFSCLVKNEL